MFKKGRYPLKGLCRLVVLAMRKVRLQLLILVVGQEASLQTLMYLVA